MKQSQLTGGGNNVEGGNTSPYDSTAMECQK